MNGPPLFRCVVRDLVFLGPDGSRLKKPYAVAYSANEPKEIKGSVTFSLRDFRRQNSGARLHVQAVVLCSVFQRQIPLHDGTEGKGWRADIVRLVTPKAAVKPRLSRRKDSRPRIVRLPYRM